MIDKCRQFNNANLDIVTVELGIGMPKIFMHTAIAQTDL